jgi:hypothetical protein
MLLTALIVGLCLLLVIVAFVAPRRSRKPQDATDHVLEAAKGRTQKAPGILRKLFPRSFQVSEKAVDKSAGAGRRGRQKV